MLRRPIIYALLSLLTLLAACVQTPAPLEPDRGLEAADLPSDLFFSEYIEGSSNNKALEIYNGTGALVNLAGYNVQQFSNGNATAGLTINLTGTIAPGDVFVLAHSSSDPAILAQADQTSGAGLFNGDDALTLRNGTTVVDVIGQIGFDPGTEWGSGLTSTADNTLRRKADVCAGDPDGSDVFDPSVQWDGFATNTFDGLGSHTANCGGSTEDVAPTISSTTPADGAAGVALDSSLAVTFSEPVDVAEDGFALACGETAVEFDVSSDDSTTYILDPNDDLPKGEECTVTITASAVTDQDGEPDAMAEDYSFSFTTFGIVTKIHDVQGGGNASPLVGQTVTIEGVVVGDFEGPPPTLRGFYVQEQDGEQDGDPLTSEAIFVFNGSSDDVSLGDVVTVAGTVQEFQGQTQIGEVSSITVGGTDSVTPTEVKMPFPEAEDGVPYLERFEGMLVTFPETLYVTEYFQLGRFGQVVVSSGGRLYQPTNLVRPGPEAEALQDANDLNRIIVDDALNNQNPDPIRIARGGEPLSAENTLRGGDTVTGLTGVLTYTWAGNSASGNAYRVRPVDDTQESVPNFAAANPRPTSAPEVGGSVRVAGMNMLNFFNTFDGLPDNVDNCTAGVGGGPVDCRGANTEDEFNRQWPKTVAAITATEADVIGMIEIENDGYGPDSAIQFLVDKLNAATENGTYAFIDVDAATGEANALGTDAIKVGLIYKPGVVTPIGQTAALNSAQFVFGGDNEPRNRPSLAQAFMENATGARFIVDVNHLKSKGSACGTPDAGDGQGNCNAVRVNAANILADWLASDPTGQGDADVLIIGDLNSYAEEDPIIALEEAGYTNLVERDQGEDAYSYVFDGQAGYLDHALANESLQGQVTDTALWHINADEPSVLDYNTDFKSAAQIGYLYDDSPYRSSDHDPVLVGATLDYTTDETFVALRYFIGLYLADGTLSQEQADGLLDKLDEIERKLERGQTRPALNQLRAFDNQIRAFARSGALSAEQGDQLLTLTQALRNIL